LHVQSYRQSITGDEVITEFSIINVATSRS
jgi:hypothetical protein